jgi:hypothetical protein
MGKTYVIYGGSGGIGSRYRFQCSRIVKELIGTNDSYVILCR